MWLDASAGIRVVVDEDPGELRALEPNDRNAGRSRELGESLGERDGVNAAREDRLRPGRAHSVKPQHSGKVFP